MESTRFWKKVAIKSPNECWIYQGCIHKSGYGRHGANKKTNSAHRYAYELVHCPIDSPQLFVCHTCDVPACVNPNHLWLGTAQENTKDSVKKNRHFLKRRTVCIHGHPLNGENLFFNSRGHRLCRTCRKAFDKKYYKIERAELARTRGPSYKRVMWNSIKTHCKHGHPLSGENLGRKKGGGRLCKTCKSLADKRYKQLIKQKS